MREITPRLTPELQSHCAGMSVDKAPAMPVSTFRKLVEHVAMLSYENRDELLFFRGQDQDFSNRAGGSTLYPAIYRGDAIPEREVSHRFDILEQACRLLVRKWKDFGIEGYADISRKRYIQWSILQHYEVCRTPLLDLTQSLRVACSFAYLRNTDKEAYIFVIGLPHLTNRIAMNSEHDLVNVRLLSICPPSALRPHFQEGYMAGTTDITTEYESKTEMDFKNRLIAKFSIPSAQSRFWGSGFNMIPEASLYPRGDMVLSLCNEIRNELGDELQPGKLGEFVREWAGLESMLLEAAAHTTGRNFSVREAVFQLRDKGKVPDGVAAELQQLRVLRNNIVHEPNKIRGSSIDEALDRVRSVRRALGQHLW